MRLKHLLLFLAFALAMPLTMAAQTYPGPDPNINTRYNLSATAFIDFHNGWLYKFESSNGENIATVLNTGDMIFGEFATTDPLRKANDFYWGLYGGTTKIQALSELEGGIWTVEGTSAYINLESFTPAETITVEVNGENVEYTVKKVAAGAFSGNTQLRMKTVTLPNTITSVETKDAIKAHNWLKKKLTYLFYSNTYIEKAVLPEAVYAGLTGADFSGCTKLTTLTTTDNPETEGINLPNTLTRIEDYEFADCENISNINIPEGITEIGNSAFYNSKLEKVTIPSTVSLIEDDVFGDCETLKLVEFKTETAPTFGYDPFYGINNKASLFLYNDKKENYSDISDCFSAIAVRDVRSIENGKFGTVCLGYNCELTEEMLDAMDIYEVVNKKEENGVTKLTMDLTSDTQLQAGKPYFFRSKVNNAAFAFEKAENSPILNAAQTAGVNGLYGSLDVKAFTDAQLDGVYMLKNNTLHPAASGSKCGANRAYLKLSDVPEYQPTALSPKAVTFRFDDVTGISSIESVGQSQDGAMYDLSGRRVNGKAAQKGIYIQNGKKVVK